MVPKIFGDDLKTKTLTGKSENNGFYVDLSQALDQEKVNEL